jgi:hypothetical protein
LDSRRAFLVPAVLVPTVFHWKKQQAAAVLRDIGNKEEVSIARVPSALRENTLFLDLVAGTVLQILRQLRVLARVSVILVT